MTKTNSKVNTLARKALPIIRARLMWKVIGGISKTITTNDNSPAPKNTKYIKDMVEEALNLSNKAAWTFAQKLRGK